MWYNRRSLLIQISFGVLLAVLLSTGSYSVAKADYFGRAEGHGYFKDHDEGGEYDDSSNVLSKKISDSINHVDELLAFLKEYNKSSASDRNRVGTAFIVNTMLGRDGPGETKNNDHKTVKSDDWIELENRLNSIAKYTNWSAKENPCGNSNAYYQVDNEDDAFFQMEKSKLTPAQQKDLCVNHDVIKFKNSKGDVVYTLDRKCANPIGKGVLPHSTWDISAKSEFVGTPPVTLGQTITWNHTVTNKGSDTTGLDVGYRYQDSSGLGGGSGSTHILPAGTKKGESANFYSNHTINSGDGGKNLCRATSMKPSAWNDYSDKWVDSTAACIYIPRWYISTASTVNKAIATPGDTITWTHTVRNDGPDKTSLPVTYHYQNRGDLGGASGTDYTLPSGSNSGDNRQFNSTYSVTQDDVGHSLCRATSASPRAWDNGGWTESSAPCTFVPYNYTLTPNITTSVSGVIEASTPFNLNPSVDNTGPTKSKDTQWQITQIIVGPGKAVPNLAGGNSGSAPCPPYFQGAGAACSTIKTGTTVFNVGVNASVRSGDIITAYPVTVGDYEVGTKVCYAFSVQPHSSSDDQWSHSAPTCLIIGKKPKVQIWGGDLWSRGLAQTSTSIKGNITFGSWVEYAIFAAGLIKGTASGSAFAGSGLANADISGCNYSTLSFTNAGSSTCGSAGSTIGNYVTSRSIPDVAASFTGAGTAISGTVVPNDLPKNSPDSIVDIYSASDLTLNGSTLVPAKSIIIKATGTVSINGDQRYSNGPYTNILQLPQLIIIANKIAINSSVTNVDAWLVAKNNDGTGEIDTCEIIGDTSDKCNLQLTVNGPVMANKLELRRTAGSGIGAASGDPAEVFNLRADAYLWASARAIGSGHIQTVYVTELPPRF